MKYKEIEIREDSGFYITVGLNGFIYRELSILIGQRTHEEYIKVFVYLIDFVLGFNPVFRPNQTIAYHSWVFQFNDVSDNCYSLWEADPNGDGYREGIDYAVKIYIEQEELCAKYGVSPVFPTFSQNIILSKGVYEGLAIEAVRYSSPNHMTGWWLSTELYDDNVESLMNVHFFHLAFKRPDILKYLALPAGYRFFAQNEEANIWFDNKVLAS